jgi:hypothetical protein
MRRLRNALVASVLTWGICWAKPADAQAPRSTSVLIGVSATSHRTGHPEGAPIGVGLMLGAEQRFTARLAVRIATTMDQLWFMRDDIALCHPIPDGCLPDAIFPSRVFGAHLEAISSPFDTVLRVVVGAGLVCGTRLKQDSRFGPPLEIDPVTRFSWTGGIEIQTGSAAHAPAFQLTRTWFGHPIESLERMTTFTFVLRR